MKHHKHYREKVVGLGLEKPFVATEAVATIRKAAWAKFDETVEVHVNLGIDPRQADQQLRGTLVLPHGTGKKVKLAVIASGEALADAKNAGADVAGAEDLIEKIQGGWFDFDILLTTPDMMAKVGKLGKTLGSKGLMPSPKSGTVTTNLSASIAEFKAGKIEYRNDKTGIIHLPIGKLSFSDDQLLANLDAVMDLLVKIRPAKTKKGVYLKSAYVCSSMSSGVKIDLTKSTWRDS